MHNQQRHDIGFLSTFLLYHEDINEIFQIQSGQKYSLFAFYLNFSEGQSIQFIFRNHLFRLIVDFYTF